MGLIMFDVEIKKNNVRTPEFSRFSLFTFFSESFLANDTEKNHELFVRMVASNIFITTNISLFYNILRNKKVS